MTSEVLVQFELNSRKVKFLLAGIVVAVAMFGFGYAMVPLYYAFCKLLGIPTARDPGANEVLWSADNTGHQFRIEFDTNESSNRLAMVPVQNVTEIRTGVAHSITYELRNLTDVTLKGRAVPSYSPERAAQWLTKLQCFCFDTIQLAPREVRRVPVVFVLDKEMPEDIGVVTLSYTFYDLGEVAPEHSH